jgi:hypothetical protein
MQPLLSPACICIVTCRPIAKATVQQPLLGNSSVNTLFPCNEKMEKKFSVRSVPGLYNEDLRMTALARPKLTAVQVSKLPL